MKFSGQRKPYWAIWWEALGGKKLYRPGRRQNPLCKFARARDRKNPWGPARYITREQ